MDAISLTPDTVLMPVPLRHAQRVADYLASLAAGRMEAHGPSSADVFVAVTGQGEWTQRMVEQLVNDLPDYPGVVALFDRCAERPATWVMKTDIENEQGIAPTQLRNELAALSKKTKKIFDRANPIWPVEWKKEKGGYYYRMDATLASWWSLARGGRDA